MMTSLFVIFDPSVSVMSLNWLSILLPILFLWPLLNMVGSMITVLGLCMALINDFLKHALSPVVHLAIFSVLTAIMSFNLTSLLPFIFPVTSHISLVVPLVLVLWSTPLMVSALLSSMMMLKSLLPQGTPTFLMPFMVLIELISVLIRPLTLSVRLVANITAGHLLLFIITHFILTVSSNVIVFLPFLAMMDLLEVGVAAVQSYVFFILVSMYTGEC